MGTSKPQAATASQDHPPQVSGLLLCPQPILSILNLLKFPFPNQSHPPPEPRLISTMMDLHLLFRVTPPVEPRPVIHSQELLHQDWSVYFRTLHTRAPPPSGLSPPQPLPLVLVLHKSSTLLLFTNAITTWRLSSSDKTKRNIFLYCDKTERNNFHLISFSHMITLWK